MFIPGWPLSHDMFEYQFTQLPRHGYRCAGVTMRGFGKSSKSWGEYNYDVFMEASPHATESCLVALRNSDLRNDLPNIHIPTVIFHSPHDKICLFELAEAMTDGINGSKLNRFENSGHGMFYEEKDKFNTALMNFVG